MWKKLSDAQRTEMVANGYVDLPNCYDSQEPYRITHKLIEDGKNQLLLKELIQLDMPIRLIQGVKDDDVPWSTAGRIMEQVSSADVELTYVKSGDHRLSEQSDLVRLTRILGGLFD